jgi:hypothetical protein
LTAERVFTEHYLINGVFRAVLFNIIGHPKEATTEYYYNIHLREVIEGTRSVNFEQYRIWAAILNN